MDFTATDAIDVNRRIMSDYQHGHGHGVINPGGLHFAQERCSHIRSVYACAAYWVRAIAVDQAFIDGNKRTALYATAAVIAKCRGKDERVANAIRRISMGKKTEIKQIAERIRYACR
jgi:prophage maintenance system killer protein